MSGNSLQIIFSLIMIESIELVVRNYTIKLLDWTDQVLQDE